MLQYSNKNKEQDNKNDQKKVIMKKTEKAKYYP